MSLVLQAFVSFVLQAFVSSVLQAFVSSVLQAFVSFAGLRAPNAHVTSHPSRGDILFHPGGLSETEILFTYGSARFASKVGQLAGNHFLTIVEGREQLADLGRLVLWRGAQDILFEKIGDG